MNKKLLIALIILICIVFNAVAFAESERIEVKYIKTSDGDTARFEVNGEDRRVRFLGINTPEVAGEDKVEEPYGNEALEYTKSRLDNAKKFEIEYDENADKEDRFGRILAYIWVDGELFQEELVKNGYAKTYMMRANYKYADELKAAEREAKANKIGVWSEEIINQKPETETKEEVNEQNENKDIEQYNEVESPIKYEESTGIGSFVVIALILLALTLFFVKNKKQ